MVAYTLPTDANLTAIADGRRFALLAAPRERSSRNHHPGAGARIHLSTAQSKKHERRYVPARRLVFSGLVTFSADGVVRVVDRSTAVPGTIEGIEAHLQNAEQGSSRDRSASADAVARACGFDDYAALWAAIREHDGEVVARQLLAWGQE